MKKFKYTILGQMLSMLKSHAVTAFFISILWFLLISVWITSVGECIFAGIGILSYFLAIYNAGCDAALDDKKPYSPLEPKPLKSLILPVILTVVNILFILLYKCSWAFGAENGAISQPWSLIGNIVSILWFSMYKPFLGMEKGHFELMGYIIIIFLPYIASFIGYFAGFKGFDIYGKLNSMAYEKQRKKKKD